MKQRHCIDLTNEIDIVVLWVDGNDEKWKAERNYYAQILKPNEYCGGDQRFRDWGLFKYWFRGVEKYAPWVRKIHLVTCGHLPEWMNLSHPKLHIVYHKDIIPTEYLPTFNSSAIELYINRIEDLAEHFIYFNDDFYILDLLNKEYFFKNGFPCSTAGLSIYIDIDSVFACSLLHDTFLLNRNFNSQAVIRKYWHRFINYRYGFRKNMKTILLLPWCKAWFPGFAFEHGPNAFMKSTLDAVWKKEKQTLERTCSHRFREYSDVNQYIFKWWQWCEGNFIPFDERKIYQITNVATNVESICNMIENPNCPVLVINDAFIQDYEEKKKRIQCAFQSHFPKKSTFEL